MGIRFPLLPEDLAELVQPTPSSFAQAISSWRLSIPTLLPRHGDAPDQWGIEYRSSTTSCLQSARTAGAHVVGLEPRSSWADACMASPGSAHTPPSWRRGRRQCLRVPSTASAGALPTRNEPVPIVVADSARIASLPSITEQPSATWSPTRARPCPPRHSVSSRCRTFRRPSYSSAATPGWVDRSSNDPDARNYLVARLARVWIGTGPVSVPVCQLDIRGRGALGSACHQQEVRRVRLAPGLPGEQAG